MWFWVLLLLGPILVVLAVALLGSIRLVWPSGLARILSATGPLALLAMPAVCAVGASFCLAMSQPTRRSPGRFLWGVMVGSVGLFIVQAIILVTSCAFSVAVLQ